MKLLKIFAAFLLITFTSVLFASVTGIHPLSFGIPMAGTIVLEQMGLISLPKNILALNFGSITTMSTPDIDGREAMGGYPSVLYIGLISDIDGFPDLPDIEQVTNINELAKLSNNFTMKATKYFYRLRVKPRTVTVTPEGQGEIGGRSFKNKGQFFIPGIDAESMGLARFLNNKFGIVIVPDQGGKFRTLYGSEDLPCEFGASASSGTAPADPKGITFTFECDSFVPGWIYNGTIPLSQTETIEAIS